MTDQLSVRGPSGQKILSGLDLSNLRLPDLATIITSELGLDRESLVIKRGFPPKPIDLEANSTMAEIGIKNKDSIIVEGKQATAPIITTKVEELKQEAPKKEEISSK